MTNPRALLPSIALLLMLPLKAEAIKESDLPANEKEKFQAVMKTLYADKQSDFYKKLTEYKQAFRDAMVKADASVAPILDKVIPVSGAAQMKASELPADEAEKYKAAQKAAKAADPSIAQKDAARKQAQREAMIKADPSIQPIVDKVIPSAAQ